MSGDSSDRPPGVCESVMAQHVLYQFLGIAAYAKRRRIVRKVVTNVRRAVGSVKATQGPHAQDHRKSINGRTTHDGSFASQSFSSASTQP